MNRYIECPPVAATTEGTCNAVEAIAQSLYVASRDDGKLEPMVLVPSEAIECAIMVLIAALDFADGEAGHKPNCQGPGGEL